MRGRKGFILVYEINDDPRIERDAISYADSEAMMTQRRFLGKEEEIYIWSQGMQRAFERAHVPRERFSLFV